MMSGNKSSSFGGHNRHCPRVDMKVKNLVTKGAGDRPKQIHQIQFGTLTSDEICRTSELPVTSGQLFVMPSRAPAAGGCLDPHLGVSDKKSKCQTCGLSLQDCSGHFGHIRLARPVFHIGYIRHTYAFLQCICKSCSRVLLPDGMERNAILRKMRSPNLDNLQKEAVFTKSVHEKCKKAKQCPHCGAINGQVKKMAGVPTLKLVHEKYKGRHAEDELEDLVSNLHYTLSLQTGPMAASPPVYLDDLLPTIVLELFQKIPDEDCEVLGVRPHLGRPENLIIQSIAVPPVSIRPSVAMDMGGGSNEDDLTVQLQEIINVNVALEMALTKGSPTKSIIECWDILQVEVAKYINTDLPGVQKPMGAKPIRGLCQRLKGKQGRFRGNLSGKRVDFSARTVISPDPNLGIHEVGVPVHVAKIMSFPEMVNRYNINKLRDLVRNGPHKHPGANLIQVGGSNLKKSLAFADDLNEIAKSLKIGDVVERHMQDGDFVLFNRQPSLHRLSIMCHQVKVMPWRTFRFNIQVCAPYNADFDGDEMNLHLIQTHEARSEANLLMGTVNNIVTPRNGEPLISASQDYLTCSYMLTQKDQFFDREEFCSFLAYTCLAEEHVVMPPPTIIKPVRLWTGKQIFSTLVKGISDKIEPKKTVSFECKEKNYSQNKYFCINDGYVCFMDSELLSGNIAKKTIGDGSKKGLIFVLLRDLGAQYAAEFMNKFSRLCSRVMGMHKGLSIGVDDVTPSRELSKIKHSIIKNGFKDSADHIKKYEDGTLPLRPGCDLLQSLEEMLNGVLGKLRESAGQRAMKALHWHNAPRIMAECGSKGSPLNISQMIACVGQQAVGGNRIANGFVKRTLPHFPYNSLTPAAKGFVANSFYTGLTPTEFFFHAMGGREGLVDTAVKTAETGYMSRRLMKALEDLSLRYDSSVRNSEDIVVQFTYGDDNLNPEMMEANDRPVDFDRLYLHISQTCPCRSEKMLDAGEIITKVTEKLLQTEFQVLLPLGKEFHDELIEYFKNVGSRQNKLTESNLSLAEIEQRCWNSCRFTETQLNRFLEVSLSKYNRSYVEPGDALGATGAMSIGEPATQMTLKTFHFAGVSSMNVTLGVPRVKEIINAAKKISTPIIEARLVKDDNAAAARVVKAGIEKTTLGEISSSIKEVYSPDMAYLTIKLDTKAIDQLKLDIDAVSVRRCILNLSGSRSRTRPVALRSLKSEHVKVKRGSSSKLRVYVPKISDKSTSIYFSMQALKVALPQVIVKGIHSINRAVINEEDGENGKKSFHLLVEGYGLAEVMGSPGVDGFRTTTNHIMEIMETIGIEAARTKISAEIFYIMNAYGIGIDSRHLLLLSDVMTFKGEVLGITRFGVAKMRESVLMLASFEKPTDHLFNAAVRGKTDSIVGVSECIIMGVPIPMGTGIFKLLKKASQPLRVKEPIIPDTLLLGGEKAFLHN